MRLFYYRKAFYLPYLLLDFRLKLTHELICLHGGVYACLRAQMRVDFHLICFRPPKVVLTEKPPLADLRELISSITDTKYLPLAMSFRGALPHTLQGSVTLDPSGPLMKGVILSKLYATNEWLQLHKKPTLSSRLFITY